MLTPVSSKQAIYSIARPYLFAVHCALPTSGVRQYEHRGRLSAATEAARSSRGFSCWVALHAAEGRMEE
jgi:hypothetical protein